MFASSAEVDIIQVGSGTCNQSYRGSTLRNCLLFLYESLFLLSAVHSSEVLTSEDKGIITILKALSIGNEHWMSIKNVFLLLKQVGGSGRTKKVAPMHQSPLPLSEKSIRCKKEKSLTWAKLHKQHF